MIKKIKAVYLFKAGSCLGSCRIGETIFDIQNLDDSENDNNDEVVEAMLKCVTKEVRFPIHHCHLISCNKDKKHKSVSKVIFLPAILLSDIFNHVQIV